MGSLAKRSGQTAGATSKALPGAAGLLGKAVLAPGRATISDADMMTMLSKVCAFCSSRRHIGRHH